MDVKCLLMKSQRLELLNESKVIDAVKDILGTAPANSYIKGKDIDSLIEEKKVVATAMENDYDFVVRQAKYYGLEFFVILGKVYFRKRPKVGANLMKLNAKDLIISGSFKLSGEALIKKITVKGISSENNKEVKATKTISGKFAQGSTANKMIGSSEKTIFDPLVTSSSLARDRAAVIAENIKYSFGKFNLKVVGIPELVPGRTIVVDGLLEQADTKAYITSVKHVFDSTGFTTTIEAGVKSL